MKKHPECDSCGKRSRSVRSVGQDSNGEPDGPDYCFLCETELRRGREWDRKLKKYVRTMTMPRLPRHLQRRKSPQRRV